VTPWQNSTSISTLPETQKKRSTSTATLATFGQKLVRGNNLHISVHPESKAEADRIFNALSAGGTIEMPIADQAWGDYYGSFVDKFGVQWMVNYHKPEAA
jgi:PhnB protein